MFHSILNAALSNNFLQLLCLQRSSPSWVLGILDSPAPNSLDSHLTQRQEDEIMTPRSHFLEGELIHWVYKAKNVYIIVDPLLIKLDDEMLPSRLKDSAKTQLTLQTTEIEKLSFLPLPSLVLIKKFTTSNCQAYISYVLPRNQFGPSWLNSAGLTIGPQICSKCGYPTLIYT